jgi:hypothetical protein
MYCTKEEEEEEEEEEEPTLQSTSAVPAHAARTSSYC